MTTITVSDFANELKRPADALLEQLQAAGVAKKSVSDALTDSDKQQLLNYLQASHGTGATRKVRSTSSRRSASRSESASARPNSSRQRRCSRRADRRRRR